MNLKKIKIKMIELELTQLKLAQKMAISPASLNLKLNGKRDFTVTELRNLCLILHVDPNYFFN
jgi:transcriptional regulator with XRE-family HTH domain